MPVEQPAYNTGNRYGHQTKNPIKPAEHFVPLGHKGLFAIVILEIVNLVLRRPEAKLVAPQSFVGNRAAAKMQGSEALVCIPLDGFPHHQVVAAKMLKRLIGGAELIDRLVTEMKKYRRGNGSVLMARHHDATQALGKHMLKNIPEKRR